VKNEGLAGIFPQQVLERRRDVKEEEEDV